MTFIPGTIPTHLQAQVAQVIASVDGFAQLHQVRLNFPRRGKNLAQIF
jgi:hypothetical protein